VDQVVVAFPHAHDEAPAVEKPVVGAVRVLVDFFAVELEQLFFQQVVEPIRSSLLSSRSLSSMASDTSSSSPKLSPSK
jgi:hypothetical protein